MAGIDGASSMVELESEGSGTEGCDSENVNKRIKSGKEDDDDEEEDRFGALPDLLVQHILCLLPATDLVKTCVLSKWWKNQWTRVPVLEFVPNAGMSPDKFSNFIDKTLSLHDSPNIHKSLIDLKNFSSDYDFADLDSWIHFAVGKDVKELIVDSNYCIQLYNYLLPEFLYNNSSLVKLKLSSCNFMSIENVNWGSVQRLCLKGCPMETVGIENVLSGSPLLQYLKLCSCDVFGYLGSRKLVIASKTLKTLVLDGVGTECTEIEISCPNLERLRISGLAWFKCLKVMNLPSSVYATLDFFFDIEDQIEESEDEAEQFLDNMSQNDCVNLVKRTLRQVQHVEKLEIGHWMMKILANSKEDGDCIYGLPDSFIHRIISFLPSTKDAFKTDYYKTWWHKWTDLQILSFVPNEKFVVDSKDVPLVYLDPRLSLWIRFAARKDIKELILECDCANIEYEYPFPQFLLNNSSLVNMEICACDFMPDGNVNWESLKSLRLSYSSLGNQAIENVLSGSPLLECLELYCCDMEGAIVVSSQHLKTFILVEFCKNSHLLEISCPNLQSLKIMRYLGSTALKLTNLPYSLHASLDFYILKSEDTSPDDCMNLVEENVKSILHVEELKLELMTMMR